MNKKIMLIAMAMIFSLSTLFGCGAKEENTISEDVEAENLTSENDASDSTQVANPWRESSDEEISQIMGAGFYEVYESENIRYSINENEKIAQMEFVYDGLDFTARFKQADKLEDISGCNYDWTSVDDCELNGLPAQEKRYVGSDETVDVIIWFVEDAGYVFSLSTSAKDLDGFDITAVAQYLVWDTGVEGDYPETFLEDQAGKTDFESYDEAISFLKKGQGYAFVELGGSNGKILLVTDKLYDNGSGKMVSIDVCTYTEKDGKVDMAGFANGTDKDSPLSLGDGMLWVGGKEEVCSFDINNSNNQLIYVNNISLTGQDEQGNSLYYGFYRENTGDDGLEVRDDKAKELFEKLQKKCAGAAPVEFTVVK